MDMVGPVLDWLVRVLVMLLVGRVHNLVSTSKANAKENVE